MNEAIYKAAHAEYTFSQRDAHLGHLPGPILRDIARNESAPREWRKAAIELMLDKHCPEVNHPDLLSLLLEVKAHREAKDEVQSLVESQIEQPLEDAPTGPFKASFTTQSQTKDDVVG
jgi:hypothetical protein